MTDCTLIKQFFIAIFLQQELLELLLLIGVIIVFEKNSQNYEHFGFKNVTKKLQKLVKFREQHISVNFYLISKNVSLSDSNS